MSLLDRGICDEDPEAGPGPSTSRFYSRSDTAPHVSDDRNSTSTTRSDDHPGTPFSDEELIYTATAHPTPNEDHRAPAVQPVEEEMAPHVALFVSPALSRSSDGSIEHPYGRKTAYRGKEFVWHDEILCPDLFRPFSHPDCGFEPVQMINQPMRRRALSFDTFDGSGASPQWPRNVPAVRVHQPPYPPPERMPTPPGLPSFGTPEAMAASAQFLQGQGPSNRRREHSPRDAIKRLLGFLLPPAQPTPPPSPPSTAVPQSARSIGRAPDGTAVLGRFAYRPSGHGINLGQRLDDHAFHAYDSPTTPVEHSPDSRRTSEGTGTEDGSFKSALSRPKRHARLYRPSIARLFASTSPERGSSPRSPSNPEPAMIPPPRNPARRGTQQLQPPEQNRPSRARSPMARLNSLAQDAPSRNSSPLFNSFQRHTVVNQTIQEEEPETVPVPQPNTAINILSRLPTHLPLCCCLGTESVHGSTEETQSFELINSRDSYITAPSQLSPARFQSPQRYDYHATASQSGVSLQQSMYSFIRQGVAVWSQHILRILH
ncbi:hypothetical protein N7450_003084 [Penicillium hetheringtonii]|uniref:Uncharacterized protein n=1 Tax=Penicillium hetheringtonii TaxID=911720 RepID=A0AAD6DXG3_9EURO|nr:hypothetical protein N7450_003084 [Penicillium hetheringtonii]